MSETTAMNLDLCAVLGDLDARRLTLTTVERARYRAAMVAVCALSPAAEAAYLDWSENLIDFRSGAAVVLAAVRAE